MMKLCVSLRRFSKDVRKEQIESSLAHVKAQRFISEQQFREAQSLFFQTMLPLVNEESRLEKELHDFHKNESTKSPPLKIPAATSQKSKMALFLEFDGASKGNPGLGGGGWIVNSESKTLAFGWKQVEKCTNNEAEYRALIEGLRYALNLKPDSLSISGDSKIVINQVSGMYQCHAPNLVILLQEATELIEKTCSLHKIAITWDWVPREENKIADKLSNLAISEGGEKIVVHEMDSLVSCKFLESTFPKI